MTNEQQDKLLKQPKREKDSHAAGSGSSTGDLRNVRGQPRGNGTPNSKQDTFGTPPDDGAVPID